MSKLHSIRWGEDTFHARSGQLLLDAALLSGTEFPHDCRAGRCGSCLTRIGRGITLGGEALQAGMVHACQARVFSDLVLEVEPLPPVEQVKGRIVRLVPMAEDIVEVTIAPDREVVMLPGQYCKFQFRGFPARPFSPTSAQAAIEADGRIRLNVKRVRGGRVTPELGKSIVAGQTVVVDGPFGHAFLRPGLANRLVLIGSGTGFAPVWAVAAAALRENPQRHIAILAASRKLDSVYMAQALEFASRFANVSVSAAVEELRRDHGVIKAGRALDHLPRIVAGDIVYAAGAPPLVEAIAEQAKAAGATFYADPFTPMTPAGPSWLDRARDWLQAG